MTKQQALEKVTEIEPYFWRKYNLTVVADGYDEKDGTRIHFVKESGFNGEVLSNAYVFSL